MMTGESKAQSPREPQRSFASRVKFIVPGIIFAVMVAAVSVGYLYLQGAFINLPFNRTPQGVSFEEILPEDIALAVSFNPTDAGERARFKTLWDIVLQDQSAVVMPFLAREFTKANVASITPEDFLNMFGPDTNFVLAMTRMPPGGKSSIYFLFSAKNIETAKISAQKVFGDSAGVLGDVIVVASLGKNGVEQAIARYKNKENSLAESKNFRRAAADLAVPLSGYVYANMEGGMPSLFLAQVAADGQASPILASEIGFSARGSELLLDILSLGNKENIEKSSFAKIFAPNDAYLYKKLPAQNAMMFFESHHLGDLVLAQFETLGAAKEKIAEKFKENTGLDLQADVLPFLDKGFAVTVCDCSVSILPAVSFYADASSAPDKAKKALENIDAKVQGMAALGNLALQAPADKPIFEPAKFKNIAAGGIVRIHPDRVPKEIADIPLLKAMAQPVEFFYGLTGDNLLFFGIGEGFEDRLAAGGAFENNPLLLSGLQSGLKPGNIAIINPALVGQYAQRIVRFAREQNSFSETNEKAFEFLNKYLSSLKGYVQISRGDGVNMKGKALLKIAR